MILNKIIIHELNKVSGSNETNLILSDELVDIDANSVGLVEALNKSYNSDRVLYAVFDKSDGKYFPEKFSEYKDSGQDTQDFISLTRNVIGNLETLIQPITLATGGYFVFSEYSNNNNDFLGIFLIRDTEGKTLSKTENSFSIDSIEYVDTSNLAMACRINHGKYEIDEENYLSLTQLRQQEISEYFKNWISIEQIESSSEYTKQLYEIISQIERPENPDTGQEYEIEVFRNLVYNYATSSPNRTINLRDLSQHFYNNPNILPNYALENDISIDTEFRYNARQLKRFIKLEVNRDGINFKISRGTFDDKVRFSEQDDSLVIIESAAFANALRNEVNNLNN
ncbi:nucleoid-associated protein [Aquimarina gracilis]|uniref:Nucleoid-associated protein n=1 Tax=Aquimarina gracilis TaxID=874422 RepID=A0ABU6A2D3_9FLAO|nr:nucleoid-associated protein [Aquimarina gracilis]MEB3348247.1 nucleoid-associated protein [Aquimarina gracilis]